MIVFLLCGSAVVAKMCKVLRGVPDPMRFFLKFKSGAYSKFKSGAYSQRVPSVNITTFLQTIVPIISL